MTLTSSPQRYRIKAYRDDAELGHCLVEAESVDVAEAAGPFDLTEALHLSFFDLGVR